MVENQEELPSIEEVAFDYAFILKITKKLS